MLTSSARLLRLLTMLQSRKHWAGDELAQRLEVTDRTLRRDVLKLRDLGYTVSTSSGPGGGYALGPGTQMPPLMFSDDEAVAVTVALRDATNDVGGVGDVLLSAMIKLDQVFPRRLRRRVTALQAMTVSVGVARGRIDADGLTSIAAACRDHEALRFTYRSHGGTSSTRQVEPARLAHTGNRRWYLVAWDVDRDDWRTFRVDRIEQLEVGRRFIPRPPPKDVEHFVSTAISSAPYRLRVVACLHGTWETLQPMVHPWMGTLSPFADDDPRRHDGCRFEAGADTIDALACQLIQTGCNFDILEPVELIEPIAAVGRRLAASLRTR